MIYDHQRSNKAGSRVSRRTWRQEEEEQVQPLFPSPFSFLPFEKYQITGNEGEGEGAEGREASLFLKMDGFLLLINWRSPARPLHSTTRRPFRKKKKRFQRPMNGLLLFEFVSYSTTNDAACPVLTPAPSPTFIIWFFFLSFFPSFLLYSPSRPLPFRLKTWREEKQRKEKGISRRAPPCDGEQLAAQ